jgi:4-hydroxy-3-polyprenylbenzoate decarboxylase
LKSSLLFLKELMSGSQSSFKKKMKSLIEEEEFRIQERASTPSRMFLTYMKDHLRQGQYGQFYDDLIFIIKDFQFLQKFRPLTESENFDGKVKIDDYKALTKYVLDNLNPATDVYFSQGPMDVLDHSCSKLGFGGKMCIDGTAKTEEEITTPLLPYKAPATLNAATLMAQYPEITSVNTALATTMDMPVLFVAIQKNKIGHVLALHQQIALHPSLVGIKAILYVEHTVNADDIADVLWRFCNNLDPRRDHFYAGPSNQILGLDGTRKSKKYDNFERDWPNIIAADTRTIDAVDAKWSSLGLGELIISPSLRYSTQLYRGGASVLEDE